MLATTRLPRTSWMPGSAWSFATPTCCPRLAAGYSGTSAEIRTAYSLVYTIPGAGGLYGTADDLVAFARAVLQTCLLSEVTMTRMVTPDTSVHPRYADGWVVRNRHGHISYSHTGGTNGFVSSLEHFPELDVTVVVLSNLGFTDLGSLAGSLAPAAVRRSGGVERNANPPSPRQ